MRVFAASGDRTQPDRFDPAAHAAFPAQHEDMAITFLDISVKGERLAGRPTPAGQAPVVMPDMLVSQRRRCP